VDKVRFFVDKKESAYDEYDDIPIPQLKSTVMLYNERFLVKGIVYRYIRGIENYNLIDLRIEHMEDENYEDFN